MQKKGNLKFQMLVPIAIITLLVIFIDGSIGYFGKKRALMEIVETFKAADLNNQNSLLAAVEAKRKRNNFSIKSRSFICYYQRAYNDWSNYPSC